MHEKQWHPNQQRGGGDGYNKQFLGFESSALTTRTLLALMHNLISNFICKNRNRNVKAFHNFNKQLLNLLLVLEDYNVAD